MQKSGDWFVNVLQAALAEGSIFHGSAQALSGIVAEHASAAIVSLAYVARTRMLS